MCRGKVRRYKLYQLFMAFGRIRRKIRRVYDKQTPMPENQTIAVPSICGRKTVDGTPCQRRVKTGGGPCVIHATGFRGKLRSLARNNVLLFLLTVISVVVGVSALAGWAYDEFIKRASPGFLQTENPWFRPQRLVSDGFSISMWIRNRGNAPVEGEVHFFEAKILYVERDVEGQERRAHAEMLADALKFNSDQIQQGFHGRSIGKNDGVWQTMYFPHLSQDQIDAVIQGHARIFVYAWARWRDALHDLDRCLYLQRPDSVELKDKEIIWHLCSDVPSD
jgi:hypothetical protein